MRLSDRARQFLSDVRFAVLATVNPSGTPQLTVMWYDLVGDQILMNTAAGRVKERNLRRNPRVSLCVEDGYRFITIVGRATLVYDQEIAQADIARLARRYHGPERTAAAIASFRQQQRVSIYVDVDRVFERGF